MEINAGDQMSIPAMKIKAATTATSPPKVRDELIMSAGQSFTVGKKRMSALFSPNKEKPTSNPFAAIAAEAMPIFSVEYNLAATTQNTKPVTAGIAPSNINKIALR